MTIRRRRAAGAGRAKLWSLGRPSLARRREQRLFWAAIQSGGSSVSRAPNEASIAADASKRVTAFPAQIVTTNTVTNGTGCK
jgi:hypothetical protein